MLIKRLKHFHNLTSMQTILRRIGKAEFPMNIQLKK